MPHVMMPAATHPSPAALLLLVLCATTAPATAWAARAKTVEAAKAGSVVKYDWHVTLEQAAPDCFERTVYKVNGELSPTLEVTQGDTLELTLYNDLPADLPTIEAGISIHWHGWAMKGYPWYDGSAHIQMCPVQRGQRFTYRFKVNEMPGTYLWHGHSGTDRVDGLGGPLIVHPKPGAKLPVSYRYHEERTLFLQDWWHTEGAALAMPLNRPFDAARQTNNSGGFAWVNNPQALLINGRGFYGDCPIGAAGSTQPPNCSVTQAWVPPGRSAQQPWASAANPGCAHENVTVEAGKTYLLRVISASSLLYQTLCIEGHDMTIVAADGVPIQPIKASKLTGCLDINSGQRYDVLLTANQNSSQNYWITTQGQTRPGSPSGYAVLHYKDAPEALPTTPPPQPGAVPIWTVEQANMIVMSKKLLTSTDKAANDGVYAQAMTQVPPATLDLLINITQPLMQQTGQVRWALNNVAGQLGGPPCEPLLDLVSRNPKWIQQNVVPAKRYNKPGFNASALGVEEGNGGKVDVFLTTAKGNPAPLYPTAGTHLVPLKKGEVVQMVLQNLAANANNGDYRAAGVNRTAQEQHPFHMHGHSFWVLGYGMGVFDPVANASALNTRNPVLRDTATLPQNGWVALRFKADNPGLWLFHCHLLWHQYMGQLLVLADSLEELPQRPSGLPKCPRKCLYNGAPWSNSFVKEQFGSSGFELPLSGK